MVEASPVLNKCNFFLFFNRPDYAPAESSDEESEDENQNDIEPESPEQVDMEVKFFQVAVLKVIGYKLPIFARSFSHEDREM